MFALIELIFADRNFVDDVKKSGEGGKRERATGTGLNHIHE